jgi:biopolymer transport protein ExbD
MTPMIDIVFLLIIFFMTVSQVTVVNRERLALPEQEGSQDQIPSVLTVNFTASGEIVVAGAAYDLSDLIALIAEELVRVGDDPTRLTVILRADRRVASGVVSRVVEELTRMDIRKVRFAVQVPQ